jgi:RHS repeat-associated protein
VFTGWLRWPRTSVLRIAARQELDQSGNLLARYARTTNIDEPLAESRSGVTSYYHQDGLGSATSLTSESGSLAQTYTFDSFGKLTASTGSVTNPFRYTGREFDSETGLYYDRARYYDPTSGHFISEDPVGFHAGIDFYNYVGNDPAQWIDPYGLDKCKKSCGLKKPPEYNVSGTIRGGTSFSWSAEFLNDDTHDPKCCEVRQLLWWNNVAGPQIQGFGPPPRQATTGTKIAIRPAIGTAEELGPTTIPAPLYLRILTTTIPPMDTTARTHHRASLPVQF